METRFFRFVLIVIAAAALGGCKPPPEENPWDDLPEEDLGPEPTCTPDASDAFCMPYAEKLCTAHFNCCSDEAFRYGSMETCIARTVCSCTGSRTGDAFMDGRDQVDTSHADAKLARLDMLATTCEEMPYGSLDPQNVFVGTLAGGADCSPEGVDYSTLFACGSGTYCAITELGEESVTGVCRAFAAPGASCDAAECTLDHFCDAAGVCRPKLASGVACAGDEECLNDLCDETTSACAVEHESGHADVYCIGDAADF